MGDKGAVRVNGDVGGQFVVGDHNVVVHAERGSSVTLRAEGPPRARRRSRPTGQAVPGRGVALLGRDDDLAELEQWLAEGHPVQVHGPPGCGKSALLRHLAADRAAAGGDVVCLSAAGLPVEDVIEDLFHACYDAEDYKPDPARRRRLMGAVQAVLFVDDFDGSEEELAELFDAAPGCDVVVACGEGHPGAEGRALRLGGLPEEAALALIARALDRPLRDAELPLARSFAAAVQGNPLALVQAAAAVRAVDRRHGTADADGFAVDEHAIATGLADRLSESATQLLHTLHAFAPVPVSRCVLGVLVDDGDRAAVAELESLHLASARGDSLRPCGRLAVLVAERAGPARDAARFAPALADWVRTRATRAEAATETAALRHVLIAAAQARNHAAVRDLARATAPVLARSLRWGTWSEVLELGRAAARELGAAEDEAYFAHEAEVRRRVLGLTAVLAAGTVAGTGAAVGHAVSAKSGLGTLVGNPAVIGAALAVVVAGGFFGLTAADDGQPPRRPGAAPVSAPAESLAAPSVIVSGGPTAPKPSVTVNKLPSPSKKPSLQASKDPPPSSDPQPSPSDRGIMTDGPDSCPTTSAYSPNGDAAFGPVQASKGETETESFQFSWLPCDDENSLSVSDQDAWSVEPTSCPPPQQQGYCVFAVTFHPSGPGDYQATVTVLDDWGRRTVRLPVTGTADALDDPEPGP